MQVAYVIDGDTLKLASGESVRLIGINTPEMGRDGRADEPGAPAAREFLQNWLQGQSVELVAGLESRDHYGRRLAHLSVSGLALSERLIAEGLGVAIALPPNTRLAECLFAAEQIARRSRVGLWRDGPLKEAGTVAQSGFALLQGEVTKIDNGRRTVWLEVDDRLVLRVDKELPGLAAELDQLLGKRVEIRGWVVDRGNISQSGRKRWFISLSDRRHLRILKI
ncbi:thermonuclease family protein [Marinobacterium lutimaris]|uniref:thermonuclease family protein n=1 Tax=Marinobacterium lutimaris TaxID=568106 RepID=UPI00135AD99F|nr:thermonuclease family protein [Marinobacterium lutimaris]